MRSHKVSQGLSSGRGRGRGRRRHRRRRRRSLIWLVSNQDG